MSDPTRKTKLSAFAAATRSSAITAQINADDVQQLRPDWSRAQAEAFLRNHMDAIGSQMVAAGASMLAMLIKGEGRAN